MKRSFVLLTALAVASCFGGLTAFAQGHGPGGRPPQGHGPGSGGPGNAPGPSSAPHAEQGKPAQPGSNSSQSQGKKTVGELLTQNEKLSSKLQGLFPEGTDLQAAAGGFKNLGEFVAAAHVSHNLGIPFDDLKTAMTGDPHQKLGQAIHTLRPEANAKAEEKKAKAQAKRDMKESGT